MSNNCEKLKVMVRYTELNVFVISYILRFSDRIDLVRTPFEFPPINENSATTLPHVRKLFSPFRNYLSKQINGYVSNVVALLRAPRSCTAQKFSSPPVFFAKLNIYGSNLENAWHVWKFWR